MYFVYSAEFEEEAAGFGVDFDVADEGGVGMLRFEVGNESFDLRAFRFELVEFFGFGLDRLWAASASGAAPGGGRSAGRRSGRGLLSDEQNSGCERGDGEHSEFVRKGNHRRKVYTFDGFGRGTRYRSAPGRSR